MLLGGKIEIIQDIKREASLGIGIREFLLKSGFVNCLLFME